MFAFLVLSTAVAAAEPNGPPTVTVSGEGITTGQPDEAYIRGGVVTVARTAAAALSGNAKAMAAVRKALAAVGVNVQADAQTYIFSLDDHYADQIDSVGRHSQHKDGYAVTHKIRVHVTHLEAAGPILDAMVEGGANDIDRVTLDCSTADARRGAARRLAASDALDRAESIAAAIGYRLGEIASIQEGSSGGRSREFGGMAMALASPSSAPTQVSGGSIEYRATVTATWTLVNKAAAGSEESHPVPRR